MKKLLLLLCLLNLFSCTIEKRVYNRGFHFEWKETKKPYHHAQNHQEFEHQTQSTGVRPEAPDSPDFSADNNLQPVSEIAGMDHKEDFVPDRVNKTKQPEISENLTIGNDDTLYISTSDIKGYREPTPERIRTHNTAWIIVNILLLLTGLLLIYWITISIGVEMVLAVLLLIALFPVILLVNLIFSGSRPEIAAKRKLNAYLRKVKGTPVSVTDDLADKSTENHQFSPRERKLHSFLWAATNILLIALISLLILFIIASIGFYPGIFILPLLPAIPILIIINIRFSKALGRRTEKDASEEKNRKRKEHGVALAFITLFVLGGVVLLLSK